MPVKFRTSKAKRFRVSAAAVARWRDVKPDAIAEPCIVDDELAEALALPSLIAMPAADLDALRAALDEAAGVRHAD